MWLKRTWVDERFEEAKMLSVDSLSFSYDAVQALRDVAISVPEGEVTCLMGRNGVG